MKLPDSPAAVILHGVSDPDGTGINATEAVTALGRLRVSGDKSEDLPDAV